MQRLRKQRHRVFWKHSVSKIPHIVIASVLRGAESNLRLDPHEIASSRSALLAMTLQYYVIPLPCI